MKKYILVGVAALFTTAAVTATVLDTKEKTAVKKRSEESRKKEIVH
jgi:hypothetical protein